MKKEYELAREFVDLLYQDSTDEEAKKEHLNRFFKSIENGLLNEAILKGKISCLTYERMSKDVKDFGYDISDDFEEDSFVCQNIEDHYNDIGMSMHDFF